MYHQCRNLHNLDERNEHGEENRRSMDNLQVLHVRGHKTRHGIPANSISRAQ